MTLHLKLIRNVFPFAIVYFNFLCVILFAMFLSMVITFAIFFFLNCYNSRTSADIDMKLGPVTKPDKRNKTTSKKKWTMTSCRKIVTSLSFFEFLANLEQSGGWIPDTDSAEVMFSVTVTFCLTKTENRTKKSLPQLSHYCFE